MIIKDLFLKPIDRDIKGVIKVGQDDKDNIQQELEEYVVTKELKKHFRDFFSNYKRGINGNTDKMGVWISGFFGSGKSHFLKILSYLLENKEVNGKRAIDYFEEGNKIEDSMVLADMKLAASTPTDVVLFNIDSKSEIKGKQSKTAIVAVLQNVFNEMLGYSGSNPFLADLERNLFENGKYDLFKNKFKDKFDSEWINMRNDFDFIQDDVVEVLNEIEFMSVEAARNWCEKAIGEYSYKVEDFVQLIKKYLDSKGKNHHIVFLIDEIGQYIGDDSKLMLNLQTITEDLGTECKGKAWIVVTSQQDIDSITKIKGDDFSKIQGRFDTRLSLSSANVDEVIKKRILEKTESRKDTLTMLYKDKETIIKNLIFFNDEVEKKIYSNNEDFAEIYPFVQYQFNILGSVLTAIRTHGASGKHLAEGERSMLALFQESAIKIMGKEIHELVPFNMFYDALEQFLDHSHSGVITKALNNEILNPNKDKECFTVNVLKTLFMIKYVKEIKANLENITSLMVSNINEDRMELKQKVENALSNLVKQSLVQKHADIYVFLTNEEQEINRAIQSQNVDYGEVIAKVSGLIFDDILSENKYRHPSLNGRYSFSFNQVVDDKFYKPNKNNDITLQILTPDSELRIDESTLGMLSLQEFAVIVALPDDRGFLDEIASSLKIKNFLLRESANTTISKYKGIIESKRAEVREKDNLAKIYLEESLKNADIYVNGNKIKSTTKDVKTRLNEAVGILVDIVYSKLNYIDVPVNEDDIRSLIKNKNREITLGLENIEVNKLALNDVNEFISINNSKHIKTSKKEILDRFMKAPYGFIRDDVEWLIAKLFKENEISLFLNNEAISSINKSENELINYITRNEYNERLMIDKKVKANEKQKSSVKSVAKYLFDVSLNTEDDEKIMDIFIKNSNNLKIELERLELHYDNEPLYPGRNIIDYGKKLLIKVIHDVKSSEEFFNLIDQNKNDYINFAEEYHFIKEFFSGKQKEYFNSSLNSMFIYDDSKNFIYNKEIEDIVYQIKEILENPKPYSEIYKLPTLREKFNTLYGALLEEEARPIKEEVEDAKKRVIDKLEGKKCETIFKDDFINSFDELIKKANTCNNISNLVSIKTEADTLKIRYLNKIDEEESKFIIKEKTENYKKENDSDNNISHFVVKKRKTLSIKSINNTSWQIETKEDVKKYVSMLEDKLNEVLEEDTIINIEF